MKGALGTIEKLFWGMVWVVGLFILAMLITSWIQKMGGTNIFGQIAQWVNDHARPQAS